MILRSLGKCWRILERPLTVVNLPCLSDNFIFCPVVKCVSGLKTFGTLFYYAFTKIVYLETLLYSFKVIIFLLKIMNDKLEKGLYNMWSKTAKKFYDKI